MTKQEIIKELRELKKLGGFSNVNRNELLDWGAIIEHLNFALDKYRDEILGEIEIPLKWYWVNRISDKEKKLIDLHNKEIEDLKTKISQLKTK